MMFYKNTNFASKWEFQLPLALVKFLLRNEGELQEAKLVNLFHMLDKAAMYQENSNVKNF